VLLAFSHFQSHKIKVFTNKSFLLTCTVNNAVCGNGTSWTTNLFDGVVNAVVVQAIINPSDSNLYVLDGNMDLLQFNGQSWAVVTSDILFITPWNNPEISSLPLIEKNDCNDLSFDKVIIFRSC
jgi:hypothetical protein